MDKVIREYRYLFLFFFWFYFACGENFNSNTLIDSVRNGDIDRVALHLSKKINPNIKDNTGETLLGIAIENGYIDIIDLLLASGIDLELKNGNGDTALLSALKMDRMNIVNKLIKSGANINAADNQMITPLAYGILIRDVSLVKELIEAGADVNAKNDIGEPPLLIAVQNDAEDIISELIKHNANINAVNNDQDNALSLAVRNGDINLVKILTKLEIDLNIKNKEGNTPLHIAVKNNLEDITKVLIASGADVNILDNEAYSVIYTPLKANNQKIIKQLLKTDLRINSKTSEAVCELLKCDNIEAQAASVYVLGELRDRNAVNCLVAALKVSDKKIQSSILRALGKIGDPQQCNILIEFTKKDYMLKRSAIWGLGELRDEKAINPLITLLRNEKDPLLQNELITAAGKIASPSFIDDLIPYLDHKKFYVRKSVVEALRNIGNEKSVYSLVLVLKSLSSLEICNTCLFIGKYENKFNDSNGDPYVVDQLSEQEEFSKFIEDSLSTIYEKKSVTPFITHLNSPDPFVRLKIVETFGHQHNPEAQELLTSVLDDVNFLVRMNAVRSIGKMETIPVEIVNKLIVALKDKDDFVRKEAAVALGKSKNPLAGQHLINSLNDESIDVRMNAIWALGEIGEKSALRHLTKYLQKKVTLKGVNHNLIADLRQTAAEALGKIKDPGALDALYSILGDYTVRKNALFAIGLIDKKHLIKLMVNSDDYLIRWDATTAIMRLKDAEFVEPLIQVMLHDKEEYVRESAARALGVIGNRKAVSALISVVYHGSPRSVRAAALALGKLGDPEAIEPLIQALEKFGEKGFAYTDTRENIVKALGQIGDPRAINPLENLKKTKPSDGYLSVNIDKALKQIRQKNNLDNKE